MGIHLTPEQEAGFVALALRRGRPADELVREALSRYLADEARFAAAVQLGLDAAEQGDFVPSDEVWAAVEHSLKS